MSGTGPPVPAWGPIFQGITINGNPDMELAARPQGWHTDRGAENLHISICAGTWGLILYQITIYGNPDMGLFPQPPGGHTRRDLESRLLKTRDLGVCGRAGAGVLCPY